jgi:hypothetical protein
MAHRRLTGYLLSNLGALLILVLALTGNLGAHGSEAVLGQTATTTTISYQGRLTNASGQPLTAKLPMVFSLYAAPTGGTPVWSESRTETNTVPVTSGLFNVLLGSVTPINISLLNRDLWLGIAVNGDPEMTPREKLASVPYAARAGLAQTVPDRSITTTNLRDGSVTTAKLSSGAVDRTKFASMTGVVWKTPPATFLENDKVWSPSENAVWDISDYLRQAGVPVDAEMILLGWSPSLISDASEFRLQDAGGQQLGDAVGLGTFLPDLQYSPVPLHYGMPLPVPGATRKIRYSWVGPYNQTPSVQPRRSLVVYGWK